MADDQMRLFERRQSFVSLSNEGGHSSKRSGHCAGRLAPNQGTSLANVGVFSGHGNAFSGLPIGQKYIPKRSNYSPNGRHSHHGRSNNNSSSSSSNNNNNNNQDLPRHRHQNKRSGFRRAGARFNQQKTPSSMQLLLNSLNQLQRRAATLRPAMPGGATGDLQPRANSDGLLPTPQMTSVIQTISNNNICHPCYRHVSHYPGNQMDPGDPLPGKSSRRHGNANDLERLVIGRRSNDVSSHQLLTTRYHGNHFDMLSRRDATDNTRQELGYELIPCSDRHVTPANRQNEEMFARKSITLGNRTCLSPKRVTPANADNTLFSNDNKRANQVSDLAADGNESFDSQNEFYCHVCNTKCTDLHDFDEHMKSIAHTQNMSDIYRLQQLQQNQSSNDDTARDYCKVCDRHFHVSFAVHKKSDEHRRKDRLTKKGCLLCKTGSFTRYPDYVTHIDSQAHKKIAEQKGGEVTCQVCDVGFSSLDSYVIHCYTLPHRKKKEELAKSLAAREDDKTEDVDKKEEQNSIDIKSDSGIDTSVVCIDESMKLTMDELVVDLSEEALSLLSTTYDSQCSVGEEFVTPVSGFVCKLCQVFYNDDNTVKDNHCKTEKHFVKYQKLVEYHQQCVEKARQAALVTNMVLKPDIATTTTNDNNKPSVRKKKVVRRLVGGRRSTKTPTSAAESDRTSTSGDQPSEPPPPPPSQTDVNASVGETLPQPESAPANRVEASESASRASASPSRRSDAGGGAKAARGVTESEMGNSDPDDLKSTAAKLSSGDPDGPKSTAAKLSSGDSDGLKSTSTKLSSGDPDGLKSTASKLKTNKIDIVLKKNSVVTRQKLANRRLTARPPTDDHSTPSSDHDTSESSSRKADNTIKKKKSGLKTPRLKGANGNGSTATPTSTPSTPTSTPTSTSTPTATKSNPKIIDEKMSAKPVVVLNRINVAEEKKYCLKANSTSRSPAASDRQNKSNIDDVDGKLPSSAVTSPSRSSSSSAAMVGKSAKRQKSAAVIDDDGLVVVDRQKGERRTEEMVPTKRVKLPQPPGTGSLMYRASLAAELRRLRRIVRLQNLAVSGWSHCQLYQTDDQTPALYSDLEHDTADDDDDDDDEEEYLDEEEAKTTYSEEEHDRGPYSDDGRGKRQYLYADSEKWPLSDNEETCQETRKQPSAETVQTKTQMKRLVIYSDQEDDTDDNDGSSMAGYDEKNNDDDDGGDGDGDDDEQQEEDNNAMAFDYHRDVGGAEKTGSLRPKTTTNEFSDIEWESSDNEHIVTTGNHIISDSDDDDDGDDGDGDGHVHDNDRHDQTAERHLNERVASDDGDVVDDGDDVVDDGGDVVDDGDDVVDDGDDVVDDGDDVVDDGGDVGHHNADAVAKVNRGDHHEMIVDSCVNNGDAGDAGDVGDENDENENLEKEDSFSHNVNGDDSGRLASGARQTDLQEDDVSKKLQDDDDDINDEYNDESVNKTVANTGQNDKDGSLVDRKIPQENDQTMNREDDLLVDAEKRPTLETEDRNQEARYLEECDKTSRPSRDDDVSEVKSHDGSSPDGISADKEAPSDIERKKEAGEDGKEVVSEKRHSTERKRKIVIRKEKAAENADSDKTKRDKESCETDDVKHKGKKRRHHKDKTDSSKKRRDDRCPSGDGRNQPTDGHRTKLTNEQANSIQSTSNKSDGDDDDDRRSEQEPLNDETKSKPASFVVKLPPMGKRKRLRRK